MIINIKIPGGGGGGEISAFSFILLFRSSVDFVCRGGSQVELLLHLTFDLMIVFSMTDCVREVVLMM